MPIDRFTEAGRPLTADDLAGAEAELGVALPAAYRAFLLRQNGGRPHPAIFAGGVVHYFHAVDGDDDDDLVSRAELFHDHEESDAGLLPIATTPGGDLVCIAADGRILLWLHDVPAPNTRELADDLDAFLASFHQPDAVAPGALAFVGAFRELGYDDGPSMAALRGQRPPADKAAVVAYLRAGKAMVVSPGMTRDVFDASQSAGPLHILTDGRFAWHKALAYYVDRYDVALPADFERHMAASRYTVPEGLVTKGLRLPDDRGQSGP